VADGTQLSTAVGTGDLIFDKDNGDGSKTPAGLIVVGTAAPFKTLASAANPVPTQLSQGGAVLSTNNGAPIVQVDNAGNVLGVTAHPTRIDPTGTTTQPVSIAATVTVAGAVVVTDSVPLTVQGTVTANVGTTGGLALDATLTGGAARSQLFDGTQVIGTAAHPVFVDGSSAELNSSWADYSVGAASGVVKSSAGTFYEY
jgi:hypothetical protein